MLESAFQRILGDWLDKFLIYHLGKFVKDIKQKVQLGLRKGELLIENVELLPEAFDYLQLPVSLKQGRVGRLSITVPWSMLGQIVISLENVYICVGQRDDDEWNLESVKRREYEGKKAKLHAAEFEKLSKRVSGSRTGQAFISYITAKILDRIQVSIKDVHFVYAGQQSDSAEFAIGLLFSSLTMKQNSFGLPCGKPRGAQVNKIVEILGLEIYCNASPGVLHLSASEDGVNSQFFDEARLESSKLDSVLDPCDVVVSLAVNKSGMLEDGVPQYSISVNKSEKPKDRDDCVPEYPTLNLKLNEIQMHKILIQWDYLGSCQLREKYGRYRPCSGTLCSKSEGWQKMWWKYAQESILSDIRESSRKTSWRYLGWRISYRRKYVNLYKTKLSFIRQNQPVDKDTLLELEQMEKESDINDILIFRSIAECESEDSLLSSTLSNVGRYSGSVTTGNQQNDEGSSARARGWINWLSLGMLGAGGTENSVQFSGVVSDEIVKNIHDVTEFNPMSSDGGAGLTRNGVFLFSIKLKLHQLNVTLKASSKGAIKLTLDDVDMAFKLWEESWNILMLVNSVQMDDPCTNKVMLLSKKDSFEENILTQEQPFINFEVDMPSVSIESEASVKVVFGPCDVTLESEFFPTIWAFYLVLGSFQFQSKKVLSSLNGFENLNVRLLSKAEHILSNRKKFAWDASFSNAIIRIPWRHETSDFVMVVELGSLLFKSRNAAESPSSVREHQHTMCSTSNDDLSPGIQLEDFYDHFEFLFTNSEVSVLVPDRHHAISIFERFSGSLSLASCILDETVLKQLKVHFSISSLCAHFSPLIYGALVGMIAFLDTLKSKGSKQRASGVSEFCVSADLKYISFHINIGDDENDSMVIILHLTDIDILCALQEAMECWLSIKMVEISSCTSAGESISHTLCSTRNLYTMDSATQPKTGVGTGIFYCAERSASAGGCFLLHYQAQGSVAIGCPKYSISLMDLDLHIYPDIVGLLLKFFDNLPGYGSSSSAHSCKSAPISNIGIDDTILRSSSELPNFGFSNFYEAGSTALEGIPLDHFPFLTINNSGSLGSLEQSLIHKNFEWRRAFSVRDNKSIRRPDLSFTRKSRSRLCEPEGSGDTKLNVIDLNLSGIKAYFHDSSCILCTVTLSVCKSSFVVDGTECLDMLISIDGLLLSSSWYTHDSCEFLWGSSAPSNSHILNIHLRKKTGGALTRTFEISFSVQHVSCVLPSEFLAILIGYFCLPDWTPHGHDTCITENCKERDTDNYVILWKVEILESTLILPVECSRGQSLHLGLKQLYISFTTVKHREDALKEIPIDCRVSEKMIVDNVHLLNIFGRDLCMSLVLLEDKENISAKLDKNTLNGNITLISPLDLDIWIRIPSENKPFVGLSAPTCIMMEIKICQINAEDDFFLFGVQSVLNVVDELSAVGTLSEGFKSDIFQFLQFKKMLKEGSFVLPDASCVSFREVRCRAKSLSIRLCRSRPGHFVPPELVAKVDMEVELSASFRNDIPLCLDIECSSLMLYSFHSRVILVQCKSDGSVSSGAGIHLEKSNRVENKLLVNLPFVEIWLQLSDWSKVIELLVSYSEQLSRISFMIASSKNSDSSLTAANIEDCSSLIVKSEIIGASVHYPLLVIADAFSESREAENKQEKPWDYSSNILGEEPVLKGRHHQYITITLQSRESELVISGEHAIFNCSVEEARGMLDIVHDQRVLSWSLFQLFQANVVADICFKEQKQHTSVNIQVDSLDMSISHQLFYIWNILGYQTPETGTFQYLASVMDLKVQLRKASLLLTDGTCSCNGPILEILLKNLVLHSDTTGSAMEASFASDMLVNYLNIQKVMWEPFIETWDFKLDMIRTQNQSSFLNTSSVTDIHLTSTAQLNLNLTVPGIEAIFRLKELIKKVQGEFGLNDLLETQRCLGVHTTTSTCTRRYAPYVLQNETSLPLLFQVSRLTVNEDDLEISAVGERNIVYPGSSVPVFTDETSQEQNFQYRPPQSSDLLTEKKSYGIARDVISIQLDGTSGPCVPISMDVVGLSYFEVNFSKASEKEAAGKNEKKRNTVGDNTFVVPVVFDVSMLHYRKLIRIYSTVILLNTTSIPLELHFDTPFGVSPKDLHQIYPGQEFPLPLHLAEAGRMICRPLGTSFLWSEAHMFSKVLAQETKLGSFRSFVCYPSHPSSDPFRCCLSIQLIDLPSSSGRMNGSSVLVKETMRHSIHSKQREYNVERSKIPSIHYVTLTTPLLIRNYMPREVSLTIETGGIARTVMISEVNCASIFHIDSTHDLGLVFHVNGFRPSASKFLRAEAFAAVARFHENKFSLSETLTFYPNSSSSPIYVTVEKTMDALCGAREVGIFVPFLLYNCTGLPLNVADLGHELEGCSMPPCYHLIEMDQLLGRRHSLSPLTSKQDLYAKPPTIDNSSNFSSKDRSMSLPGNVNLDSGRYSTRLFTNPGPSTDFLEHLGNHGLYSHRASLNDLTGHDTSSRSHYSDHLEIEKRKVEACMYCPHSSSSASELMVRLRICMPGCITDNEKSSVWSSPFYLVPASGSTCVVVPRTNTSGAFIVSVTSSPLTGPFSGRTRAITFQPRYVISNACSKDLCYKQKGTDSVFHLRVGQHSHLHWADPTRDLLVSLVYNEPGWLWSGSFFPDHLGDTQVKMRNYVHGALSMIRVEVHNADVTIEDEKIVGSPNGNSGTLLILLYDDDTGFIPYRIDNFSKERLRIYQENCKAFETTIHSYMSCPYTWDEPCYPHRLVVEVLGERVLGSYTIDDVTEQIPIYLPSTSEKPGRQLFLSIHADGAVKVLSLLDSSYLPDDMKDSSISGIKEKTKFDQKEEIFVEFSERISVHIPYIGVSMIDSCPQELLFVSANDTMIDLMQNAQVQKFYFQISSLQVDNQLHNTAYPVILSLDHESGGNSSGQMKNKDDNTKLKNGTVMHIASEGSCQPIFFFSASKRRNKEISLIFFEYIKLRLAALRLELEEELIVCMFDFVRSTILKLSRGFPCLDSALDPLSDGTVSIKDFCPHATHYESLSANRRQIFPISVSKYLENRRSNPSLPSVVPIEDFWQQIYFLARRQNKIYIEVFDLAPIKLTLSFSSGPWMLRNEGTTSAEYLRPISGTAFQRGLMALADVEGAPVYLKQLTITHHMGTLDSFHEILIRHFTPELLHEMYKIFGSASVIGNPMGFAKNLGLGIKDFLSVPATGILKSPSGLFTGMAQGITSLFYSTVYASSTAATQFSKSVHKSIVAFTFDDQAISTLEKQWTGLASHSKGVLNEFLEGLTGLLQSPIRGAEKHGLPGFLSGVALGTAGVVARPVASILEVTGKTAQSIRNRSRLHRSHRFRARFPRPLTRELPLQPYSWEEAIGISMLQEADDVKFKDEIFVTCRTLKQKGEFLIITERFVLVVLCPSLVGFGTPEFRGVADPQWILEVEMSLDNVISVGRQVEQVNIVGINSETTLKEHQHKIGIRKTKWWSQSTLFPLFQTSIELASEEEADNVLRVIMSTIEKRKQRGLRVLVLHRSDLR